MRHPPRSLTKRQSAASPKKRAPAPPPSHATPLPVISTRLASRPNFSGYTYKDDMVSDGLENAIQALGNFDPDKSSNPFAYFTQIIWYAFLRRIEKEKKQMYIKHKVIENSVILGTAMEKNDGDSGDAAFIDLNNDYMNNFVQNFEDTMERKKVAKKDSSVDDQRAREEDKVLLVLV